MEIANDVWIQTLKFSQHRVMRDKQGEAAHLQKTKFNIIITTLGKTAQRDLKHICKMLTHL